MEPARTALRRPVVNPLCPQGNAVNALKEPDDRRRRQTMEGAHSIAPGGDEPRIPKGGQVTRHARGVEVEVRFDLARAQRVLFRQEPQDGDANGMGEADSDGCCGEVYWSPCRFDALCAMMQRAYRPRLPGQGRELCGVNL